MLVFLVAANGVASGLIFYKRSLLGFLNNKKRKRMMKEIKFLARKAIVFSLLALVSWQVWEIESKFNFFPILKIFSFELFLSERLDPAEMLDESFSEITREFEKAVEKSGGKLEIKFVSKNEKMKGGINPTIFIEYDAAKLNGKEIKIFKNFSFNDSLFGLLAANGAAMAEAESRADGDDFFKANIEAIEKFGRDDIALKSEIFSKIDFSPEEYEKLRKEFPKLKYSKEELGVLKSNGCLMALIHPVIHLFQNKILCSFDSFKSSSLNFKIASDEELDSGLLMCANYFYKKNFGKCWWASLILKERRELLALFIVAFFLMLHFFQKDLGSLLDEESERKKISMSRKFRWQMIGRYWKYIIWPFPRNELIIITRVIFREHDFFLEREAAKKLKKEAWVYWKEIEKLKKHLSEDELRYLQDLFARATDLTRTFSSQVTALSELKIAEKELETKIRIRQNAVAANTAVKTYTTLPGKRSNGNLDWIDRRDILLSELQNLLPKDMPFKLGTWDVWELENLKLILLQLKSMRQDLRRIFLRRGDFRNMLKNNNPFMLAIRSDDKKGIIKILGIENDNFLRVVENVPVEREPILRLKEGLSVTIVGYVDSPELREAVKELSKGSARIYFRASDKGEGLVALGKGDPKDKLILSTAIPHGYVEIFKKNNLAHIHVGLSGKDGYKQIIIREVRKKYTELLAEA